MKIRKSSVAAAVATVAAGAMLAMSTPAYAATTLTVWADDMVAKSLTTVVKSYEKANNVKVNVVVKDFGKLRDLFITASGAGNAPDIMAGAHDWTGKLVASGSVAPINLGAAKAQLTAPAVAAFLFQGKNYGVPMATENIAVLRNVKVAPTAPKTWAEMVKNGVEIGFDATGGDPYHFYPLQSSFGAPVFTWDNGWTTKLGMGGAKGAEYANWLADQKNNLKAGIGWDDLICNLATGKKAYWITGPWATNSIRDGVKGKCEGLGTTGYSIDAFPSAGGYQAKQFLGARGFYLSAKSKNKVAATKFLTTFLTSKSVQTQIYKDGGRIPANKQSIAAAGSDKNIAGFAAAGLTAVPMPNIVAMDSVWDKWGKAEAAIVTGKSKDPEGDWASMVAAIQKIVDAG